MILCLLIWKYDLYNQNLLILCSRNLRLFQTRWLLESFPTRLSHFPNDLSRTLKFLLYDGSKWQIGRVQWFVFFQLIPQQPQRTQGGSQQKTSSIQHMNNYSRMYVNRCFSSGIYQGNDFDV